MCRRLPLESNIDSIRWRFVTVAPHLEAPELALAERVRGALSEPLESSSIDPGDAQLAIAFGAKLVLEDPTANPFLERFYRDARRYALRWAARLLNALPALP